MLTLRLIVLGLAAAFCLTAVPVAVAEPPVVFSSTKSQDSPWPTVAVTAPNGVLLKMWNGSMRDASPTAAACWKSDAVWWAYDGTPYAGGALEWWKLDRAAAGYSWVAPDVATSFSVHLPPPPPFDFAGILSDGQDACGDPNMIAFVAPSHNTYRLTFGLTSGAYRFRIDPYDWDGDSGWVSNLSSSTRDVVLEAGAHEIWIEQSNYGTTNWSITGIDLPPELRAASAERAVGPVGTETKFWFYASESGTLTANVLQGGNTIRSLVDRAVGVGEQSFRWDGRRLDGSPAGDGTYTIRVLLTDYASRVATHDFTYTVVTPPAATLGPSIAGNPWVGSLLTANPGGWAGTQPISFSYQWQVCWEGLTWCDDIDGATNPYYAPTSRQFGDRLRVVVTASNAGASAKAESPTSGPITNAPLPPPAPPPPH